MPKTDDPLSYVQMVREQTDLHYLKKAESMSKFNDAAINAFAHQSTQEGKEQARNEINVVFTKMRNVHWKNFRAIMLEANTKSGIDNSLDFLKEVRRCTDEKIPD